MKNNETSENPKNSGPTTTADRKRNIQMNLSRCDRSIPLKFWQAKTESRHIADSSYKRSCGKSIFANQLNKDMRQKLTRYYDCFHYTAGKKVLERCGKTRTWWRSLPVLSPLYQRPVWPESPDLTFDIFTQDFDIFSMLHFS